jgi:hypothetical protein
MMNEFGLEDLKILLKNTDVYLFYKEKKDAAFFKHAVNEQECESELMDENKKDLLVLLLLLIIGCLIVREVNFVLFLSCCSLNNFRLFPLGLVVDGFFNVFSS